MPKQRCRAFSSRDDSPPREYHTTNVFPPTSTKPVNTPSIVNGMQSVATVDMCGTRSPESARPTSPPASARCPQPRSYRRPLSNDPTRYPIDEVTNRIAISPLVEPVRSRRYVSDGPSIVSDIPMAMNEARYSQPAGGRRVAMTENVTAACVAVSGDGDRARHRTSRQRDGRQRAASVLGSQSREQTLIRRGVQSAPRGAHADDPVASAFPTDLRCRPPRGAGRRRRP